MKYRSVDTDFASLERELRGELGDDEDVFEEIPEQYADLVSQYDQDDVVAFSDEAEDEDRR